MLFPETELIIRLSASIALGALVGAEREYRSKPAGFRTMMLISLGACVFTMLSQIIGGPDNPDRIAANIATGVGFLGAGVIFRDDNGVNGITTAATIWAVAAIGMAAGAGHLVLALTAALMILAVLAFLPVFQRTIDRINQQRIYTICFDTAQLMDENFAEAQLKQYKFRFEQVSGARNGTLLTKVIRAQGRAAAHHAFTAAMLKDLRVLRFEG